MKTNYIIAKEKSKQVIDTAVEYLIAGDIITIPTETVYGLGVDLNNEMAIEKLYTLKNRPVNNPLTAYIYDTSQVKDLCDDIPDVFYKLADKFLPGPLAIVMKKKPHIPSIITGGLDTIGIRITDNKITLEILKKFGKPLAGTSANISGELAFRTAMEIYEHPDLTNHESAISLIIDDGPSRLGIESTVLSLAGGKPKIIREGFIKSSEIEKVIGKI